MKLSFSPFLYLFFVLSSLLLRTVMKSSSELVKAGLRTFFENAAEDLEKTLENLKLGKFTHSRSQMKGVSQNINYTTVALLPILTALFEHITEHHFGVDLLCESHDMLPTPELIFRTLKDCNIYHTMLYE